MSAGKKFREAIKRHSPLQIVGTINAYAAMMAKEVGFKAIYLSGAGVANSSYGLPDLGMTTLDNVLEDVRRITSAVDLPLLVDIDTGWGSHLMIGRSIRQMIKEGAAGIHIEDQAFDKRCGHLEGKTLVSLEEMAGRIKAAADARSDPHFFILARIDAYANEGMEAMIERAQAYLDAGADGVFPEALPSLDHYAQIKKAIQAPILANLTEFGKTPLLTIQQLAAANVDMALYPLSVNRAMNLAALKMLSAIYNEGTQLRMLSEMQTREELYHYLKYESYQSKEK